MLATFNWAVAVQYFVGKVTVVQTLRNLFDLRVQALLFCVYVVLGLVPKGHFSFASRFAVGVSVFACQTVCMVLLQTEELKVLRNMMRAKGGEDFEQKR